MFSTLLHLSFAALSFTIPQETSSDDNLDCPPRSDYIKPDPVMGSENHTSCHAKQFSRSNITAAQSLNFSLVKHSNSFCPSPRPSFLSSSTTPEKMFKNLQRSADNTLVVALNKAIWTWGRRELAISSSEDDASSIVSDAISYESNTTVGQEISISSSSSSLTSSTTPSIGETSSVISYADSDSNILDSDSGSECGESLPESEAIHLANCFNDSNSSPVDLPALFLQVSFAIVLFSLLKSTCI